MATPVVLRALVLASALFVARGAAATATDADLLRLVGLRAQLSY